MSWVWREVCAEIKAPYIDVDKDRSMAVRGTHRNPDGTIITGAHIHLYREGYGDRWAWRLHEVVADFRISVQDGYKDFCDFCNITKPPKLQMGLF